MTGKPFHRLPLGICGSSAANAADLLVEDALRYADTVSVVATPTAVALFLPALRVPVHTDDDWKGTPAIPCTRNCSSTRTCCSLPRRPPPRSPKPPTDSPTPC
ncbi:hypothetical protein OG948_33640 [Embleya sp. NBC_00888]|nr:hypothetical protein OG948_33640 [Embleya sp. NBC_00888]